MQDKSKQDGVGKGRGGSLISEKKKLNHVSRSSLE